MVVNPKTADGLIGEDIQGGLAEQVRVPASNLVALPSSVDDDIAAAIPINFGTSLRMLMTIGKVQAGEMVLVLGASGGVGAASVQIAKMLGAEVLAPAGSAEKLMGLRAIGADHVIDYTREDFSRRAWDLGGKRGVQVIVNFTDGETFVPSMRALARHGRLLVCGATAGYAPPIDLRYLWRRELQVLGSTGYTQTNIATAVELVAEGKLKRIISHRFPLADAATAQQLIEDRNFFGKIILRP